MLIRLNSQVMKYKVLLKILHGLVLIKRFFWATGSHFFVFFGKITLFFWKKAGYIIYKISIFFKKLGLRSESLWFLRRDNLQIILFLSFFIICLPQTVLFGKEDSPLPGQNSLAYKMFGPDDQYKVGFEEVFPETSAISEGQTPIWRLGIVGKQSGNLLGGAENINQDNTNVLLTKNSLIKPSILPGVFSSVGVRKSIIDYIIEEGDSLGGIAHRFGISVDTLLWENNLTLRSIIKPGQILKVLPVTGVSYVVKKGDTLKKIANTYKGVVEDMVFFNGLEEDGSNLKIGEKIIIPNEIGRAHV